LLSTIAPGVTTAILVAATAAVDPGGLADQPTLAIMTLTVLVCVSAYSSALMRSDLEHRTDSILDPLSGLLNRRALTIRFERSAQGL